MNITVETLLKTRGKEITHLNMGDGGFGYIFQSVEEPRFGWTDRVFKGHLAKKYGKSSERKWRADGVEFDTIEEAAVALQVPPVFTAEEAAALALAPLDWTRVREFEVAMMPDAVQRDRHEVLTGLRDKGAVEAKFFPTEDPERRKIIATEPKWRRVPTPTHPQGDAT